MSEEYTEVADRQEEQDSASGLNRKLSALLAKADSWEKEEEIPQEEKRKILLFSAAACLGFLVLSILLVALIINSVLKPIRSRTAVPSGLSYVAEVSDTIF